MGYITDNLMFEVVSKWRELCLELGNLSQFMAWNAIKFMISLVKIHIFCTYPNYCVFLYPKNMAKRFFSEKHMISFVENQWFTNACSTNGWISIELYVMILCYILELR